MNLIASELAALRKQNIPLGVFFFLATDPAVRLWLGVGDYRVAPGVDVTDTAGGLYRGFGTLVNVPETEQLINGEAEGAEFVMSGVSTEALALVGRDQAEVKQKAVTLSLGILDRTNWQMLGALHPLWSGKVDFLSVEKVGATTLQGAQIRRVKLAVSSSLTGNRRRANPFWIDAQHRETYPDDVFFERMPKNDQTLQKVWPRF